MPSVLTDRDWEEPQLPRTQEKFLRAFAPIIPWYSRPPDVRDCPKVEDFMQMVHQRMLEVLQPKRSPSMATQDLSFQRRALRHICYRILIDSMYCFSDNRTPDGVVAAVRRDLDGVRLGRVLPVRHWHHPLSSETHRIRFTPHGNSIDATIPDARLAEWLQGEPIEKLVEALPEFTQPSPYVRLVEYAPGMRRKIKSLLDSSVGEQKKRSGAVEIITEEWLLMTDPMGMQERASAAASSFGLNGIMDAPAANVASSLNLYNLVRTAEEEERINPLLQQLVLRLALEQEYGGLIQLGKQWEEVLMHHRVSPCDRPSLNLAMLAYMASEKKSPLQELRNRLG